MWEGLNFVEEIKFFKSIDLLNIAVWRTSPAQAIHSIDRSHYHYSMHENCYLGFLKPPQSSFALLFYSILLVKTVDHYFVVKQKR